MASRSLGQLTIDLIAKVGGFTAGMTKAERDTEKFKKDMAKKSKEIEAEWNQMNLALAAGIAGLGLVVASTVRQAGEVSKLSAVANATTTEFQRMAAASDLVGINQEKLSDQLKDFTEKVGEFNQTGAGGMKDFFEQIAPKVGVTAEAFRNLSGPQALQLYYDSLEKAGLNQQQMSFYLESMASDTTALIPLLADGGKMLKELGDSAEATGAVMDTKTIQSAEELRIALQIMGQQTSGLKNQFVAAMIPTLGDLAIGFADVAVDSGMAAGAGEIVANVFKGVAAAAAGAYAAVNLMGRGIAGAFAIADASGIQGMNPAEMFNPSKSWAIWQGNLDAMRQNGDKIKSTAKMVLDDLDQYAQKSGEMINQILGAGTPSGAGASSQIAGMVAARQKLTEQLRGAGVAPAAAEDKKKGKTQGEKDADAAGKFLQTLRDQVFKTQEKTAYEQLFYDIQAKGLKLSSDQLDKAVGLATVIDLAKEAEASKAAQLDKQNALYEAQNRLISQGNQYQLEMATYGMGNQAAEETRQRITVMQQHQQELRQMQQDQTKALADAQGAAETERVRSIYAERLAILQETQAQELEMFGKHLNDKRQKEKDWLAGMQSSIASYAEESANLYDQVAQASTNVLQGMEDALVNFATTGKLSFRSLTNSIIADIVRAQARAAISGLFGSIMGAMGGGWQSAGIQASGAVTAGVSGWGSASGAALPGLSVGGYTGPGGKYDPAGIVHAGEYVINAAATKKLGLDYLNSLNGYASGGYVGAAPAGVSSSTGMSLKVNVINQGGPPLEAQSATMKRGSGGELIIEAVVRQAVSTVAGQLAEDSGEVGQAMRVRTRMGM